MRISSLILCATLFVSTPSFALEDNTSYILSGGLALGALGTAIMPTQTEPKWRGPALFDVNFRNSLRLDSPEDRNTTAKVSDVMLGGLIATPFAYLGLREQLTLRDATLMADAFFLTGIITNTTKKLVVRRRPDHSDTLSYFSGHSSFTFTTAGLLCSTRYSIGSVSCVPGVTFALFTGLLRIAADKHFATDVLTGAIVGFASGFITPYFLFTQQGEKNQALGPMFASTPEDSRLGLRYVLAF